MPAIKRPNQVTVDLGPLKQPWLDWCVAAGVTPSDALRQVIERLVAKDKPAAVDGQDPTARPTVRPNTPERATHIQRVRLTPSEHTAAQSRAQAGRYTVPRWIASLVRAQLTHTPELDEAELQALGQSNLRLLQIGRNLNQIARALNTEALNAPFQRPGPNQDPQTIAQAIDALRGDIQSHVQTVSQLLEANLRRWAIR